MEGPLKIRVLRCDGHACWVRRFRGVSTIVSVAGDRVGPAGCGLMERGRVFTDERRTPEGGEACKRL